MVKIECRAVLLDIEGTVSPVAFVYDVMFPYIRQQVNDFLANNWDDAKVQQAVVLVGQDIGAADHQAWLGTGEATTQQAKVTSAVHDLMDRDAKVTGLKQLQGLIWKNGFGSGKLVAELFPDVLSALKDWRAAGLQLFIYSSGSIGAQKLFFGHTIEGDLLDMFVDHFDTTSGNKKEAASYQTISESMGLPANEICFISDVVAELDAAKATGMQTVLRPAADLSQFGGHDTIESFAELQFGVPA